jgi:hypothetical protein
MSHHRASVHMQRTCTMGLNSNRLDRTQPSHRFHNSTTTSSSLGPLTGRPSLASLQAASCPNRATLHHSTNIRKKNYIYMHNYLITWTNVALEPRGVGGEPVRTNVVFNQLLTFSLQSPCGEYMLYTVESHCLRFLLIILGKKGSKNHYFWQKNAGKRID